MNIAYIRVSSQGQNLEAQRETLKQYNIEKWFEEKVKELQIDVIHVHHPALV